MRVMEFENDVRISFSPGSHVTVVHPPALGIAIGLTAGFILGFVFGWFLGRRDRGEVQPSSGPASTGG